jgi:hypothetical protein
MVQDKRILFIAPAYFDYPEIIRSELEAQGATVDLFYSLPSGFVSKFAAHASPRLFNRIKERYFRGLPKRIKGCYDYVLIIRADLIQEQVLKSLRQKNPDTIFIQYLWDDIGMFPALLDTFRYFDRILSYDIHDSRQYGLIFRPFFFVPDDKQVEKKSKVYDLFFIGSFHTDRLEVIEKIKRLNPGINFYAHLYISPITFLKRGIPLKKLRLFRFRKMSYGEMNRVIRSSMAVLDIPKPAQRGLSTRIFEAMGAGSKVITTNANVKEYEFYNDDSILIIDRDNTLIDCDWMKRTSEKYDYKTLDGYHCLNWIRDIIGIDVLRSSNIMKGENKMSI